MRKLTIIGDIHGCTRQYFDIIDNLRNSSICVGDLELGYKTTNWPQSWDRRHTFIFGNHDQQPWASIHPNSLGAFGYIHEYRVAYISGAETPKECRDNLIHGVSWWNSEQLSDKEFDDAKGMIEETRPEIIITHDCPDIIKENIMGIRDTSKTSLMLQSIMKVHKPKYWVHGHWHKAYRKTFEGVNFIGLDQLETVTL